MRIGVQTWGSYGDVRPFLAISGGLAAAGHEVTLFVTTIDNSDYTDTAHKLGVRLQMIGTIEMGAREDLIELGRKIVADRNPIRQLKNIMNELFHGLVPTIMRAPVRLPNLGKPANRFFWGLIRFGVNQLLRHYINRFRLKQGLPRINDCFDDVWISKKLNLIGVSTLFCEHQKDWGSNQKVCGFFDIPQLHNEGILPSDLQQFIDAGEPPVFMGFGSIMTLAMDAQQENIQIFMDAAKAAGCRAIIQASLWQECDVTSNNQFHFVAECPHAEIFPQCTAVVHHGGSGTTQTTTKAGVPSIIVIHLADQEGWAHETRRIGIAPKAIRRHKLTSALLADRIRTVMDSSDIQSRAKQVGEQVRGEDGVSNAVAFIEGCFGKSGVSTEKA
jgi:UDP:flavonoid glycosyltransferase YjiC (YdhE family)